jgi:hypothetical protein
MSYTIITPPKPIGGWRTPWGYTYYIHNKKPRWLTRKMVKVLFELTWEDAK